MSAPTLPAASGATPHAAGPRSGAAAAAALLFDAQRALERIRPGSPAVAELGMRRLLAEVHCSRTQDVTAVHRAGVHP